MHIVYCWYFMKLIDVWCCIGYISVYVEFLITHFFNWKEKKKSRLQPKLIFEFISEADFKITLHTLAMDYEEFDECGIGIDEIIDRFYISGISAAKDEGQLEIKKITHILSVMKKPLPDSVRRKRTCLNIDAIDSYKCNLQQYFPECLTFIDQAREAGGSVLVHWLVTLLSTCIVESLF